MTFESTRRDLIHFRNENSRSPALAHRASTLIEQLSHLQKPTNPRHEARLKKAAAMSVQEMEAAKRANGKYEPAHCRVRPYKRARS